MRKTVSEVLKTWCFLFCILVDRPRRGYSSGSETRGGYITPNHLTVYPPTIWVWSSSASPPIIWLWCAYERRSVLKQSVPFLVKTCFCFWCSPELGKKSVPFLMKTFFFGLYLNLEKKSVPFLVKSSLNLLTWKKSWSRFIPPMLKIGQNWGKIANYHPNAQ